LLAAFAPPTFQIVQTPPPKKKKKDYIYILPLC
jgi:hypothetical protein